MRASALTTLTTAVALSSTSPAFSMIFSSAAQVWSALIHQPQCMRMSIDHVAADRIRGGKLGGIAPTHKHLLDVLAVWVGTDGALLLVATFADRLVWDDPGWSLSVKFLGHSLIPLRVSRSEIDSKARLMLVAPYCWPFVAAKALGKGRPHANPVGSPPGAKGCFRMPLWDRLIRSV